MKRIILIVVSISFILQQQFNTGVHCHESAQSIENQGYKLEVFNVRGENIQRVQFTLVTDCYVTLRVMDQDMTMLAEGDMETGMYSVYYKGEETKDLTFVRCNMEIYRDQSKTEMLCKKEILLPVN